MSVARPPEEEGTIARIVRLLRFPVRFLAVALAIGLGIGPYMDGFGLFFAIVGGLVGVAVGEGLGHTRVRDTTLLGAAAVAWAVVGVGYAVLVGSPTLAWALGPSWALWFANTGAFAAGLCVAGATLRAASVRYVAALYAELALVLYALVAVFASHRDGSVARPLWLSDLAWSYGIDPTVPLVALGVVLALGATVYALLDTRDRLPRAAFLLLPLLVIGGRFVTRTLEEVPPAVPRQLAENTQLPPRASGAEGADGQAGEAPPEDPPPPEDGPPEGTSEPLDGPKPEDGPKPTDDPGGAPPKPTDEKPDAPPATPKPPDEAPESPDQPEEGESNAPANVQELEDEDGGSRGNPPVAVVSLDDDYEPPDGYFYFRQSTLTDYDGHRLVPPGDPTVDTDVIHGFPASLTVPSDPVPGDHQRLVHQRVGLIVTHPEPFGLADPMGYAGLPNPSPGRFLRTYAAVSLAPTWTIEELTGRTAGDPDWSDAVRAAYLEAPEDPRYAELADRMVQQLPEASRGDPFAKALVIKRYLDENMRYTRRSRHEQAADPVADFLFGDLEGYCVHSSHATVYLWRAAGLPSRVGTGYLVDAADRRGSTLLVRAGDAHAWPEVYLDGVGWVIADVTPKENLDPPSPPMDEDTAALLGDMLRKAEPKEPPYDWSPVYALVRTVAIGLVVAFALLVLAAHLAWRLGRQLWPIVAPSSHLPRAGYRAALDRLAECGAIRAEGESREAFARRVGSRAFVELTELHLAGELGRAGVQRPAHDRKRWIAGLRALHNELPGRGVRRYVGGLDPSVPWRAR